MISQFFILSARGDTIINRDFRSDLIRTTPEIFFRKVKTEKGDSPPIFNIDGINYVYLKASGLYIVATTRHNVAPSLLLELLRRISKLIKDFCGVLTEEAIRKNFVLIYEIIDEAIDFGYPQLTSTELVKPFIVSEPVPVDSVKNISSVSSIFNPRNTISSVAVQRPVWMKDDKTHKNEIFVDIFEKMTVLFNASGYILNSSIEGFIQMKSYLLGDPELKLGLNEDLVIGKQGGGGVLSGSAIEDCNFNECVNTNEFDLTRVLRIKPPTGEFTVMNYRVTGEFPTPFRIYPFIDEVSTYKLELQLKIRATFPKEMCATYVTAKFTVPKSVSNVFNELGKTARNQKVDYNESTRTVEWTIQKMQGGTDETLITKISLLTNSNTFACKREIGPIILNFEVPMYNPSGLAIRYLKIESREKDYNPSKWVRFVTQSSSYVCRI